MHQRINNICSKAIILKVRPTPWRSSKTIFEEHFTSESANNFAWFAMEGVSHFCWLHELLKAF
jgi:hypothetical protein